MPTTNHPDLPRRSNYDRHLESELAPSINAQKHRRHLLTKSHERRNIPRQGRNNGHRHHKTQMIRHQTRSNPGMIHKQETLPQQQAQRDKRSANKYNVINLSFPLNIHLRQLHRDSVGKY